jgi:hypothetical protein
MTNPKPTRLRLKTTLEVSFALICVKLSFFAGVMFAFHYEDTDRRSEITALTGATSASAWAIATFKALRVQDEANFVAACFAAMSLSSGRNLVTACIAGADNGAVSCRWE